MKETQFIRQNQEKWRTFEETLKKNRKDPDKLSDLFVQVTDDLSYSRTYYPNRSVRVYLNSLAQQVFYSVYKNRKSRLNSFSDFWKEELPRLVWESRWEFLVSLVVFVLAFLIGAVSTAMDPDFPRLILGDEYVNMTLDNIANDDPMAVYKQSEEIGMSVRIGLNNLMVAFRTFVLGIAYGIGTIFIMIYNGIMVGSFQYFFYQQDVLLDSMLTIWIHGTLEISAIIIAGAAGLTMGKGMVFPGTYSRGKSFQVSARRGLKIMLGITPIIIAAALIEGFVTRYTDMPNIFRAAFILSSLFFILAYFVWYPRRKAMAGFKDVGDTHRLAPDFERPIDFTKVKSAGEIFTDTFLMYKKYFSSVLAVSAAASACFTGALILLLGKNFGDAFGYGMWLHSAELQVHFKNIGQYFNYAGHFMLYPLNAVLFTAVVFFTSYYFHEEYKQKTEEVFALKSLKKFTQKNILKVLFVCALFFAPIGFLPSSITTVFILFSFPLLLLWLKVSILEESGILLSINRTSALLSGSFGTLMGVSFMLIGIGFIVSLILSSSFLWFFFEIISWNFKDGPFAEAILTAVLTFSTLLIFAMLTALIATGMGVFYASLREITDANSLREKIFLIGTKTRVYGLEKES